MAKIAYTVRATCVSGEQAEAYAAWLRDGHLAAVVAGGARSGACVRLDDEPGNRFRVEARYEFPDRAAFDAYVRDHAPALRQEGLRRFGPETGVRFERTVGVIAGSV